ncbi:MAG: hypothetical protein WAM97_07285 [Acidimicrobiales bacterium]
MTAAWRGVVLAVGILVLVGDLWDILRSLVVPRSWSHGPIVATIVVLRGLGRSPIERIKDFERKDRLIAGYEAILTIVRLGLWLGIALIGYALVFWGTATIGFTQAFIRSGSYVFTLGFATPNGAGPSAVAFLAAATGLVIVALQIAYLPALYDAFNRRETLVSMLESRAASPAWGPELLARHHLIGLESELASLYADWERWSADVAESHTTYPSLLHLRSPHPTNSWIVSLVAICDAAALQLSLQPSTAPGSARMCVRMGFSALRDIATLQRISFDPDPMPDAPLKLTYEQFVEGVKHISDVGVDLERSAEEAWPHFRGWRVNYEGIAYELARRLSAPPAPWTGPREHGGPPIAPRRPVDRKPNSRTI